MRKPYEPTFADKQNIERGNFVEADTPDHVCNDCKLEYWRHRRVRGYEWLTRLCSGTLVKID